MNNILTNLIHNMFWALMFMACSFALSTMSHGEAVERPMPAGSPSVVMQDCEAHTSKTELPTGVVVQEIGGNAGTRIIRTEAAVTKGLLKVLDGKGWKGMRVLNFCK